MALCDTMEIDLRQPSTAFYVLQCPDPTVVKCREKKAFCHCYFNVYAYYCAVLSRDVSPFVAVMKTSLENNDRNQPSQNIHGQILGPVFRVRTACAAQVDQINRPQQNIACINQFNYYLENTDVVWCRLDGQNTTFMRCPTRRFK